MFTREDIEHNFQGVSRENPVYAKLNLYLGNYNYTPNFPKGEPYETDVLVAITNLYTDGDSVYDAQTKPMLKCAVLEPGDFKQNDIVFRGSEKYDWLHIPALKSSGEILEPTEELRASYDDFIKTHKEAPFVVKGCIYDEVPSYMNWDTEQRFPNYDEIDGTDDQWVVEKGTPLSDGTTVQGVRDVEKWVIENHPAYLMGFSAFEQVPSGDFLMTPVPSPEYGAGFYASFDDRRAYVDMRAETLGVTVGEELAEIVVAQKSGALEDDIDPYTDAFEEEMPAEEQFNPDDFGFEPPEIYLPEEVPERPSGYEDEPEY